MTRLSDRQREVLHYVAQGLRNKDIADRMFITADTVKQHLSDIAFRLGTTGRAHAVAEAMRRGLLT